MFRREYFSYSLLYDRKRERWEWKRLGSRPVSQPLCVHLKPWTSIEQHVRVVQVRRVFLVYSTPVKAILRRLKFLPRNRYPCARCHLANPLNYGANRVFPPLLRHVLFIHSRSPPLLRHGLPSRISLYDQFREIISVVPKVRHLERPINPATTHFVHVLGVCLWPVPTERPIL